MNNEKQACLHAEIIILHAEIIILKFLTPIS